MRGTISDFGAAQVIQLIASQRKSGRLELTNAGDRIELYFREGAIIGVDCDRRLERAKLGSMLVSAGLLKREELKAALKEPGNMRLGQKLISRGTITRETLHKFLDLQRADTLDALFQWSSGSYELDTTLPDRSTDELPPISAESLVMKGLRIINDWPAIREKLPPFETKLERARELPPHIETAAPEDEDAGLELISSHDPMSEPTTFERIEPNDRAVFALVGAGLDIHQIIARSQLGTFETCRALATLISYGYVTVPRVAPKRSRKKALMFGASAAVAAAAMIFSVLGDARITPPVLAAQRAAAERRVLERELAAYKLQVGVYPVTLEELRLPELELPAHQYRRLEDGEYELDGERSNYPWISQ